MIGKLFKKSTPEDLLNELEKKTFDETVANSMLKHIDINHTNQKLQNFLHKIIIDNRIESVKWLLKNGIEVNTKDAKGDTALMLASKHGHINAVEELLKYDADVNCENYKGYTAIEFSVLNNHFTIYKKLKSLTNNINKIGVKDLSLLHLAVRAEDEKIVQDLFDDEKYISSKEILLYKYTYRNNKILNIILDKYHDLDIIDSSGKNILFYIVENGIKSEDILINIISRGINVNALDNNNDTLLLHLIKKIIKHKTHLSLGDEEEVLETKAKIKNMIALLPVLIEEGVDTRVCNKDNENILTLAAKNKCLDILDTLFEYEVNINILDRNKNSALSNTITKGLNYSEVNRLLLDFGASANIKDCENRTVIEKLIDAVLIVKNNKRIKGSIKRDIDFNTDYKMLLESVLMNTDANLTQLNSKDEPYFFDVLRHGNTDLIKTLIKHGADINQPDINGVNIIYKYMDENQSFKRESEQKTYYNNLQAVLNMGANVNAKDPYGGITLHKAILNTDAALIRMLLHNGADINAIDNKGRHIIHNSIWKNDNQIFKLVYTYNKALLNEPDKFGVMPINYAAFLGYTDLVLEFIDMKAHVNNPYKKTKYILNFLKKFHKNLKTLIEKARTKTEKEKILILVENMKKEFDIKD